MLLENKYTVKGLCTLNKYLSDLCLSEFTYENFWNDTLSNCALHMYVHKSNNLYKIVKDLTTETWFLCSDLIKIVYIPFQLYDEFCFDYTSSTTVKWHVYGTNESLVAFCVSDTFSSSNDLVASKQNTREYIYNYKGKLLSTTIGNFLILNRSFLDYTKKLPHKMTFLEEVGYGPVSVDVLNFLTSLQTIYGFYKHYPPHYLRLF